MQELNANICFLWNSLINDEFKLWRLIESVKEILELNPNDMHIRVRGKFSLVAIQKLESLRSSNEHRSNITLYLGDTFKQWKFNSLEQALNTQCSFIVIMQEDYKLVVNYTNLSKYLNYCVQEKIDYGRLSNPAAFNTSLNRSKFHIKSHLEAYLLTKKTWKNYRQEQRYILSFPGFYSKRLFIKNIISPKPYLRRYHPYSPFDFEKDGSQTWIFPIMCVRPNFEILACLDDDLGYPGSSLQKRLLVPTDQIRNHHHFNRNSARGIFFLFSAVSRKYLFRNGFSGTTISPLFINLVIKNCISMLFKFLKYVDYFKYSLHALFLSYLSKETRRINKIVKSLNF